jgi:D-threo-aldose 1-dehydrogenase
VTTAGLQPGGEPEEDPVAPLPTRRLGRSPVRVTELSFGGAAIGNLFTEVTDADARAAIDAAWDGGIRAFDTAPHYGLGLSERRLGDALRHRPRDAYVISTKVGRLLEPADAAATPGRDTEGFAVPARYVRRFDFSADGVRRSLEASLRRLGLDRVDIALIHDPDDHGEQAFREAYPALEKMRAEGMVRAIGVGMNEVAMLTRFVTDTDIDVVLEAGRYTLLDRSAAGALLPTAMRRGCPSSPGECSTRASSPHRDPAQPTTTPRHRMSWSRGPSAWRRSARASACRCGPRRYASRSPTPPSPAC